MRIIIFTYVYLMLMLPQACSENWMDEVNEYPDSASKVLSRYIITDAMTGTAFNVTGSEYSFYAGIYAEINAGVNNKMYGAQTRSGEPQLSSTYNDSWKHSYKQLRNLKIIQEKCSVGGSEEGNYHTLGIAQILFAYNLAILTDLFGDVPFSEALQPGVIFQPKLDKQEEIYKTIFELLEEAIRNLHKESSFPSLGDQDLIYHGDTEKWLKAANGLLARYTLRLSFRNKDYEAVVRYADLSFKDNTDELKFVNSNVPNPFARYDLNMNNIGTAKSFYDLLLSNGKEDVRVKYFFTTIDGKVKPFDNSQLNPIGGQKIYSYSALLDERNPIYLMSFHELLFIKAEAQYRLGNEQDAYSSMKMAIRSAFLKDQPIKLTPDQADLYLASIEQLSGEALLKKIMTEKYISFYENEGIEAYNDIRRLIAMNNAHLIPLVNPRPTKFPKRFCYANSDLTSNKYIKEVFGDGSYVYLEPVWWAGGNNF